MMHKKKEFRFAQRNAHINRKDAIIRNTWGYNVVKDEDGRPVCAPVKGKLDKGKVHCSCGLCRFDRYTMQDRRRAMGMLYELQDEGMETVSGSTVGKLRKAANDSIRKGHRGASYTQKSSEKPDYSYFEVQKKHNQLSKTYQSVMWDVEDLQWRSEEERQRWHELLDAGQIHEAYEHRSNARQLREAADKRLKEAKVIAKEVKATKALMDALLSDKKKTYREKKILDEKVQAMIA